MRRLLLALLLAPLLAYGKGPLSFSAPAGGAPPAGHSDSFTGAAAALATHDANWSDLSTTSEGDIATTLPILGDGGNNGFVLDGSGHVRGDGDWANAGARYTASTADVSQIVVKAIDASNTNVPRAKGVAIRASGTHGGYMASLQGGEGGANWTDVYLYRNSTWVAGFNVSSMSLSHGADHTLRIWGTGSFIVHVSVDGTELSGSGFPYTDGSPLAAGSPGFYYLRNTSPGPGDNGKAQSLFDDWTDQ